MIKRLFVTIITSIYFAFPVYAQAIDKDKTGTTYSRENLAENITACDSVLLIEYQSGVCEANIVEVIKDSTQRYHVGQPYSVDQTPCEKDGYRLPDGLLACHSQGNKYIEYGIYNNKVADFKEPLSLSLQKIRQKLGAKAPEKETIIAQQPNQEPLSDNNDTSHFAEYLENKDWKACDAVMLVRYDPKNCMVSGNIEQIFLDKTQRLGLGQAYPYTTDFCRLFEHVKDNPDIPYSMLVCHDDKAPEFSNFMDIQNNKMPLTEEPVEDFFKRIMQKTTVKSLPTLSNNKAITTTRRQITTATTITQDETKKEFIDYWENKDWNACDAVLLVRYDPDNCASGERIERIFFDKTQQLAVGQPYPHDTNEFCYRYRGSCDDENTIYNVLVCHNNKRPAYSNITNVKDNKMPFTDEPVEDFLNRVLNKTANSNNPIKP